MRPDEVETVLQQVSEMHKADIIEPSTNPFHNSPIFLVDKKNNTKRMIVDLRRLNANIVPMQIQLPKINELLDEILSSNCSYSPPCGTWRYDNCPLAGPVAFNDLV